LQSIPLVRASSVLPLFEFLEQGGGGLHTLLERARPAFRGAEALLPIPFGGALFEDAARASGLEDLGLRLGRATEIDTFGRWGQLVARSPTVGAFLQTALASYRAFNTGYRLWTVTRGDEVWLHLRYCRSLQHGRAQTCEFSLLIWLATFRRMLGPSWRPTEIHLEGDPPRHAGELEALAARRICFRQPALAIVLPRRDLARRPEGVPLAAAPDLGGPVPALDFVGSVRQTVESLLRLGALELSVAAEAAGTSERSFQRRLGQAGLTFSEVVEAARFEVARRMLADPAVKVIDVSTELGYSDAANFTRAFRRWSGVPPQIFRRADPPAAISARSR
jgi:AraC-like DNA-binding protein